jgi:iron complex outermembrane receptor protein
LSQFRIAGGLRRPSHLRAAILAGVSLSAVASGVCAQSQPAVLASLDPALEEVVVTAQRRAESAQDVPAAITVVGGSQVLNQEVHNAGELTRFVPNFTADTTDGHMRPKWFIRGIGASDASTHVVSPVGTYIDDVYFANPSAVGFPLFDLERVEVLRGPQGTLWGKNTTGGAINFISRAPSFTPGGYLKVGAANYGYYLAEGAVGGALIEDKLAARLSVHTEKLGGYADDLYAGGKAGKGSDTALRAQLLARPVEGLEINANVHYRKFNGPTLPQYQISNRTDGRDNYGYLLPTSRDVYNSNAPADDEFEHKGATLHVTKDIGRLQLVSITGYDKLDRETVSDGDGTPNEISRSHGGFDEHQVNQELRLASPKSDRFNWIIGGHYFRDRLAADTTTGALPSALNLQFYRDIAYVLKTESLAGFVSGTFNVTDRLSISGGLRQTRETKSIDLNTVNVGSTVVFNNQPLWWLRNSVNGVLPVVAVQDDKRTWNGTTYDITPEYKLTDNARVYARYAKGFRSGNFNGGAQTQAQVSVIDPEHLKSYEVGLKSEWFEHRLNANVSAFYYDYTNIQQNVIEARPQGSVNTLRNAGAGRSEGVEFELLARPIERLTVGLNVGLLDTKFTDFQASPTLNAAGNRFVRTPRNTSTLNVDYKVPLPSGAYVQLGTDWSYRSDAYFNATNQTNPHLSQKGYALGNATVAYVTQGERLRIAAYVQNLTDKTYRNTGLAGANGYDTYSLGPPRTYGVTLTGTF